MLVRVLVDHVGRKVLLTDERLNHILEHPEMNDLKPEIARVLSSPDLAIRSLSDHDVVLYYRKLPVNRVSVSLLCVAVKYPVGKNGFVLTAYLTDRPKKGEQLWPID